MNVKHLLLASGALLTSTAASAGGFQVTLAGQKNNGMGGVGVGLSLDQAAMFYNPGALAMVRERGVQVGVNATMARSAFRAEYGGSQRELRNSTVTPFNLYAGIGPSEGKFRAGIAVYTPFGSKLQYATGWEGRYSLTDITLESIFVQPTVSYAITEGVSIGAGLVVLAYGSVNLQRDVPVQDAQGNIGHVELDGKAQNKLGYNIGLYLKPSEVLSIGLSYRSRINAHVKSNKGDVKLSNIPASLASRFTATNFDVTLPLPGTATLGVGVRPNDKLTLGLDVNFTEWHKYQQLNFTFDGVVGGNNTSNSRREYKDAFTFRLGGQYQVSDAFTVRAGGSYDLSPVKEGYVTPETPDADRVGATLGASYKFSEHFGVDISAQFIDLKKRSQTQQELIANNTTDRVAGTYKTRIVIPGIGLNYTF